MRLVMMLIALATLVPGRAFAGDEPTPVQLTTWSGSTLLGTTKLKAIKFKSDVGDYEIKLSQITGLTLYSSEHFQLSTRGGNVLMGTIEGAALTIDNDELGSVKVEWSRVRELSFPTPQPSPVAPPQSPAQDGAASESP